MPVSVAGWVAVRRARMPGESETVDEIEALQVACSQFELVAHSYVEQSELRAEVAKGIPDRQRQGATSLRKFGGARLHRFHIVWRS
jgi:hypothetical protein